MPMLKTITAHNGCSNIQRYLEKEGRALYQNFHNIADETNWSRDMDETRELLGHNRYKNSVSYRHYIISPDPWDGTSITSLENLANRWADEHWADGQYVITIHIDSGIPHAHIVVNSSNIESGHKWHINDGDVIRLAKSVQDIGLEDGMTPLPDIDGHSTNRDRTTPVRLSKSEERLIKQGIKPWKNTIRDAADVAITNAVDYSTFVNILRNRYGIETLRSRRDDNELTYVLPDGKKATSKSLGMAYTWPELESRLGQKTMTHRELIGMPKPHPILNQEAFYQRLTVRYRTRRESAKNLHKLEHALTVLAKHDIKSSGDLQAHIYELQAKRNDAIHQIDYVEQNSAGTLEASRQLANNSTDWLEEHGVGPTQYSDLETSAENINAKLDDLYIDVTRIAKQLAEFTDIYKIVLAASTKAHNKPPAELRGTAGNVKTLKATNPTTHKQNSNFTKQSARRVRQHASDRRIQSPEAVEISRLKAIQSAKNRRKHSTLER
ncbi:hypothetical protein FACS1894104_3850 [Actinomycetota bacterium]|nr:hypothetical protein FACS1894104_3850 [Actinomycetota bacterium]